MSGTFLSLSVTTLWETESNAFEKSKDRTLTKIRFYNVAVRPLIVTSPCARKDSACCVNTDMTSPIAGRASGSLAAQRIMSFLRTPLVTRPICFWVSSGTGSSLMHISHNNKAKL